MQIHRVNNTKRNILFGFLNKLVTILYPFILRTIIIRKIGIDFVGLNSLFSSILQILSLAELGFSSAIAFSLYKPIAYNDKKTISAILNYYRKIYIFIGLLILFIGCLMLPFISKLIKGPIPNNINIQFLYILFLLNTVISYLLFAYKNTLLNAYQRNDIVSKINTVIQVFLYSSQLLVILISKNYYFYVACTIFSTIITNIITEIVTNKIFPDIKCVGKVDLLIKRSIKEKISGLFISKVNGISRNAFDSVFMSIFLGLTETAIYSNYYYIMNSITAFLLIFYTSLSASIGNCVVLETEEKNFSILNKLNFIYMWISGWCSICLLCLFQPFTQLFFGKEMLFPITIVFLICCYFYILKIGDMLCLYSEANGLWWKMRFVACIETICNITLNYILGKKFGASGIISGTMISLLIVTNIYGGSIIFRNYFKSYNYFKYLLNHFGYFIITASIGTVLYTILLSINDNSVISFMLKVVVCGFVPNILYMFIYKRTKIYNDSINWLLDIFHIGKNTFIRSILL